jgi:hypothetical protein
MRAKPGDVVAWLPCGPSGCLPGNFTGCVVSKLNPPTVVVGVVLDDRCVAAVDGKVYDVSVCPTWLFVADDKLKQRYLTQYGVEDLEDFDKSG